VSGLVIEGFSPGENYVYFWWHGVDGDAKIEDGKVVDVQVTDPRVFELPREAELSIALQITDWIEKNS